MRKKSTSQKPGIHTGISKHKVRNANPCKRGKSQAFFGVKQGKIIDLGRRSFDFILLAATKLRLVGFTRNENHQYIPLRGKNKVLHGLVIAVLLLICCQKTLGTLKMLIYEDLRMESFVCIAVTLIYVDAAMVGVGVFAKPQETMDILNSWSQILSCLREIDSNVGNLSEFHDISASLKVITILLVTQAIALAGPTLTFMDDIPISLFESGKSFGWFPDDGTVAPIWWKLLLSPLEYLSSMPPTIISACGTSILFLSLGVLRIYLRELGNFRVVDMRSRELMEKMYLQLTLFNRVVHVWLRFLLPLELLAIFITAVILLNITIRYTQLPLIFYFIFPYVGIAMLFITFWQCHDMIQILRATEDIMDQLFSHKAPYLRELTKVERTKVLKKAKGMRPLVFPVGDGKFSLNLPITIWEEILNQLVLLLSL